MSRLFKKFNSVLKLLKKVQSKVFYSIAFYPVLLSSAFFIVALLLLYAENLEFVTIFKKKVPYLLIQNHETARTILSTLFGSILSLTVFSFTMVMVVLSQASSNFSPRLLPGLVSNKKHQIILGFYIGTLTFTMMVLISLGAYGSDSNAVSFSVMVASIFGLFCIGLFVYFIHSISQAIQIHNIIDRIYNNSKKLLNEEIKEQQNSKETLNVVENENQYWKLLKSHKTGYYRSFDHSLLQESIKKKSNILEVLPYADQHVWKGSPILKIKEPISNEEMEELALCFYILSNRHEDDSGVGGMIKLTEVAVKALSPGINDPGTAINAISKIGQLLHKSLQIKPKTHIRVSGFDIEIIYNKISPEELMRIIIQPIREYAKSDSEVTYDLLDMLLYLQRSNEIIIEYRNAITEEIENLCNDLKENITNNIDVNRILALLQPPLLTTPDKKQRV
ncbi:DUF2254 domain-containing protein [Aquimarina addita]|uniref:DUF2254 domain-containing protein n=1 Tax=Aquimarina addita TaxID=870485 RepID=A0ABP7X873_9FLAO